MVGLNNLEIPIYEYNSNGTIKPNYVFHRPLDKVHSRCIEYPFSASKITDQESRILDIGISKASEVWINWLDRLSCEVYGTDYDNLEYPVRKIKFVKADVRNLPYEDNYFDLITAVSVIEHIGLANPQVNSQDKPVIDIDGDLQAVAEISRILRGGKLMMTLPFGIKEGLILGNEARNYTTKSVRKFEKYLKPETLEYYEYQSVFPRVKHSSFLIEKIKSIRNYFCKIIKIPMDVGELVIWQRLPQEYASAKHEWHVEGIICGVWVKKR